MPIAPFTEADREQWKETRAEINRTIEAAERAIRAGLPFQQQLHEAMKEKEQLEGFITEYFPEGL